MVYIFVEDCWILMMSSVTFRQIQSHWKYGTGWLLPLHGKWGWWKRNLRKSQNFEVSCMLCKLEFLWKGKWNHWYLKIIKFGKQEIYLPYQSYGSWLFCFLRKTSIISVHRMNKFRALLWTCLLQKCFILGLLFSFLLKWHKY